MRVVVTGTGCVCAAGTGVSRALARLYEGRVPAETECRLSADLPSLPLARRLAPSDEALLPRRDDLTRTNRLALLAAREALRAAGLWPPPVTGAGAAGVCVGSTVGTTFNNEPYYRRYREGGDFGGEDAVGRYLRNDPASTLARELGAGGPRATVTTACAAGTDAIGLGAQWVADGRCEVVLAGGSDELSRFTYLGFASLKNSSSRGCRPFDRERDGLNLGEGAAFLVLEPADRARARGARVLAEIAGYAAAADAYHPTAPDPGGRGLEAALRGALAAAGVGPREVAFVNAHGTGTRENDRVEGQVLRRVLGGDVPVVSTKGATGHALGAAGALEAVFTVHCLQDGLVPPTVGFAARDEECAIVPTRSLVRLGPAATVAVSTSLAFGGGNSVLVVRRVARE